MHNDLVDIVDFMDLINFTVSNKFIEVWRHKFSERFLKSFQYKILESINRRKTIKLNTLFLYLQKNNKYSKNQIANFFESINIDLYRPLIQGDLKWKETP